MSRSRSGWALGVASALAVLVAAELGVRVLDGQPVTRLRLEPGLIPLPRSAAPPEAVDALTLVQALPAAAELPTEWFLEDPAPVVRGEPTPELRALEERAGARAHPDLYKLWNERYLEQQLCGSSDGGQFAAFPGFAFAFPPAEESPYPRYRFFPSATTPIGLVTNAFGWRGREIAVRKPERVVRIGFLGASTTVEMHSTPWAWPDHVEHWLNRWARARGYDVRFEALNTAREGVDSPDIAAIVRQELPRAEPDLLVYHEGSNQFNFRRLLHVPGTDERVRPAAPPEPALTRYSALARRVQALGLAFGWAHGEEGPKTPYELRWPDGLDPQRPRLDHPQLPLDLGRILADLDAIRAEADRGGAQLVMTSFVWMVWDGMILDPETQPGFSGYLGYLQKTLAPYHWGDVRRLADFQNRVFQTWAADRGVAFVDVDREFPRAPRLFFDPIHTFPAGSRLRGWLVTRGLVPILERLLASGALPRPSRLGDVEPAVPFMEGWTRVPFSEVERRCP